MVNAINLNSVLKINEELHFQKQELGKFQNSIGSVKEKCASTSYRTVVPSLDRIMDDVLQEAAVCESMESVLQQGIWKYENCESRLSSMQGWNAPTEEEWVLRENVQVGTAVRPKKESLVGWEDLFEFISGMSGGGLLFSGLVRGFITPTIKEKLAALKNLIESTGEGAVALKKGGTAGWKSFLGLTDDTEKIAGHGLVKKLGAAADNFLEEFRFSKQKGKAGNYKAATKWAGIVFDYIGNLFENKEEMVDSGISSSRAAAETVIETATDFMVGAGAAALAGAAATAIGGALCVTVPGLVVGAGAVALTVGANTLCKWVTRDLLKVGEKDIGEVVADSLCELGKGAVNCVKKAGDAIKNTITSSWKNICGAFS